MKNADYQTLFGVPRAQALRELTKLVDADFLRREGDRKATTYYAGHLLRVANRRS